MTYDFKAWLQIQPDDKEYNFMDCTGKCAVGQYMKHRGESWDMVVYQKHIFDIGGSDPGGFAIGLKDSKTFGELKRALETV